MAQENPLYKEIQKYKNMYKAEHRIHEVRNRQLRDLEQQNYKYQQEYREQKAIINEMAKQLAGLAIWDNNIEDTIILGNKEDVIEYYRKEVEIF